MDEKQQKIKVNVPPEKRKPEFTNVLFLHVNESEFIFDFGFVQPQEPVAEIVSRIVTSPIHAKRFLMILQNSIKKYEETFGEIEIKVKKPFEGGIN